MNIYNDITLIIVCFNSYKLIQKNLSEISKFKTIIVDNSKSDEIRLLVEGVKNIKYHEFISYDIWDSIEVESTNQHLVPFLLTIQLQKLELYSAVIEGSDIHKSRYMAKSVTCE